MTTGDDYTTSDTKRERQTETTILPHHRKRNDKETMTNPDQEQVGKQDDGNKDGALMAHQSQAEARGVNEQEEESSSSSYFCSYLFVELTFSLVLMIVALILEFGNISPRKRPIPFQQLSSSGEYIPNPVINETTAAKKGDETFSGTC